MAVMAVPILLMIARQVAQKFVVRAVAKAAPAAAARAASASGALGQKVGYTVPVAQRLPVIGRPLRNIARQPQLLGLKPVASPAGTKIGRAAQALNPKRLTSPLWTQKMPLAAPTQVPGVAGKVTARAMGTGERLGRTLLAPVRGLNTLTSPQLIGRSVEYSAYAGALGKRRQRNNQQPATPYDPANYQGPMDDIPAPTPAQPPARPAQGGSPAVPAPGAPPVNPTRAPSGGAATIPDIDNEQNARTFIEKDQQNRDELNANLAAIAASYNSTVNEIRRLYNLSETEEERELLRFQLADLEAQVEAGQTAVRNLYAEKTANIQLMAKQSRTEGAESARAIGQVYEQSATDLEGLQEARRAAQTERNRGLGIGAVSLEGDYGNLLRTMAPIAQSSAQAISDIGSQGLEYLGALSQSMGAAREGELQSLAAARNAAMRQSHMERVLDRINADRSQMNKQLGSVLASRASSIANAIQSFKDQGGDPTFGDMYDELFSMAENNVPPSQLDAFFAQFFPGMTLSPELKQQYNSWYNDFKLERDLGLRASGADMTAAESRALQERIAEMRLRNYSDAQIAAILGITFGDD